MLYSKRCELEDKIVQEVLQTKQTIKSLHLLLTQRGERLSLRAVYKAVHKLMAGGVLLKAGKEILIDQEWVYKIKANLLPAELPILTASEQVSYTFTSIERLDAFWKTIALGLARAGKDQPFFFYNPHNFWICIPERKESEDAYYQHFLLDKQHAFFTIGGNSEADLAFKRSYQNEYLQIDLRDVSSLKRTEHLTVLGDYIVTVRLSKKTAGAIDMAYSIEKKAGETYTEVAPIYGSPMTIHFKLEHNRRKAQKLMKLLSLNFYFRRD